MLFLLLGIYHIQSSPIAQAPPGEQEYLIEPLAYQVKTSGIQVEARVHSGQLPHSPAGISLFIPELDSISIDHWMIIQTELKLPKSRTNPHGFDYQRYLKTKGISYTAYVPKQRIRFSKEKLPANLRRMAFQLQQKLQMILSRNLNEIAGSVAGALVLGIRSELDDQTTASYRSSGAMHMLAVSGMHVGILYLILTYLFRWIPIKWLRFMLSLLLLWAFAFVTGLSPSVLRAVVLFSFIHTGRLFNRKISIINMLAASALLLLLINPYYIYAVGFQLSYLAVLGIVLMTPVLDRWKPSRNKYIRNIRTIIHVSLAAQLFTTPLALYYFGQFPIYFLLGNLIVVPLAAPILCGGLLLLALSAIPVLSRGIATLLNPLIEFNVACSSKIGQLPGAMLSDFQIQWSHLCFCYLLLFLTLQFVLLHKKRALFIALIAGIVLNSMPLIKYQNTEHKLIVFDAGKSCTIGIQNADSLLILSTDTSHASGRFSWKPYVQYEDLSIDLKLISGNLDMNWNGQRILVRLHALPEENPGNVDLLFLDHTLKFRPQELMRRVQFRKLVLISNDQVLEEWPDQHADESVHLINQHGYLDWKYDE